MEPEHGYCIRTGSEITYDPIRPFCYSAWQTWNSFGDENFSENYCHKTGQKSYGKTSIGKPFFMHKNIR